MTANPMDGVVPLFDRLVLWPPVSQGAHWTARALLQASLRRDLLRLCNARNGLTPAQFLGSAGGVLHYGLPDLSALSIDNSEDLALLARVLAHALQLYEPRLSGVQVQAQRDAKHPRKVLLGVSVHTRMAGQSQRLAFVLGWLEQEVHEVHEVHERQEQDDVQAR